VLTVITGDSAENNIAVATTDSNKDAKSKARCFCYTKYAAHADLMVISKQTSGFSFSSDLSSFLPTVW